MPRNAQRLALLFLAACLAPCAWACAKSPAEDHRLGRVTVTTPDFQTNVNGLDASIATLSKSSATIVFDTTATPAVGVYSNFDTLYADYGAFTGALTIFFPKSVTIPVHAYTFQSAFLVLSAPFVIPNDVTSNITFPTGSSIAGVKRLQNANLIASGSTPAISIASGFGFAALELAGDATIFSSGSSPALVADTTGSDFYIVYTADGAAIASPTGAATSSVKLTGTGFLLLDIYGTASAVRAGSVGAPTAAQVLLNTNPSARLTASQTGILDTHVLPSATILGDATQFKVALTAANWTGGSPANLADALNRMATKVKALNDGGTIP